MKVRPAKMLRESQKLVSKIIQENDAKMIVMKMSGGKTASTLDAVVKMLNRLEINHVLIVAPRFVALNTWPDEIEAWEHTRALSYAVAVGDAPTRRAAIKKRAEITTINTENLQWLAKEIKSINNWYWDMVIIDESSRFKAGEIRTKTTKYRDAKGKKRIRKGGNMTRFGVMATARRKIKRIVELTGTPAPKGPIDLWGQAYLLDQGEALGPSKSEFEKKWFDLNEYSHVLTPHPGAEEEILKRIQHLMVTIPQEKVTADPIFVPLRVSLSDKNMREYEAFKASLYSEEYGVEAITNGVLANKLLQFCNGSLYREDRSVVHVHDEKLDALSELVEQLGDNTLLTFYSFKFDKDQIKKRFPDAVVANEYKGDLVGDWNKGKIKHLLAHPASIGHGTNLQHGGHNVCWYGLTFSLELWLQANARLPRPGQEHQVMIYPIIARGTYDERAMEVLTARDVTQERIINSFVEDTGLLANHIESV